MPVYQYDPWTCSHFAVTAGNRYDVKTGKTYRSITCTDCGKCERVELKEDDLYKPDLYEEYNNKQESKVNETNP